MGVERSDYVVVGANIGFDNYDDEKFEEVYEEFSDNTKIGKMTYLIDGYSGRYFIIGEVLAVDSEGYNGINLDLSTFSDEELSNIKRRVFDHIKEVFGVETNPSIIFKTHWT